MESNRNSGGMPYNNWNNNWENNWNNNWNNDWGAMDYRGGIYYPDYGMDMENQSDIQYMKELYPELAKRIQMLVDEECDRMEYDGSMMYDEFPDRVMIYQIVQRILERLVSEGAIQLEEPQTGRAADRDAVEASAVSGMQCRGNCCGGNCRNPQFEDLIQVILLNEIFKRRSNRRDRRRRYW